MATAKKEEKPKKVMDVSKPSETKAEATSKPVIVGHKAQVQDPMVADDSAESPEATTEEAIIPVKTKVGGERRIEPLSAEEKKPQDGSQEAAEQPEGTKADESPQADEQPEKPPKQEPEDKPADDGNEGAPVDGLLSGTSSVKEAEVAAVQRQEAIDRMVSSGDYKLPIGTPRKHRRKGSFFKGLFAVLAVLVLLGAVGYLLIDAKIIKADINLPYEFFKDAQVVEDTGGPVKKVETPKPAVSTKTVITTKTAPLLEITLEDGWKNVDVSKAPLSERYLFAAEVGSVKNLGLDIITNEQQPTVPVEQFSDAYIVLGIWKVAASTNPDKPSAVDPPEGTTYTEAIKNCTELGEVTIAGSKRIMTMHNGFASDTNEEPAYVSANQPIVQYIDFLAEGCNTKVNPLYGFPNQGHVFKFKDDQVFIRLDTKAKALGSDETGLVQPADGRKLKALPEIQRLKSMLESIKLK